MPAEIVWRNEVDVTAESLGTEICREFDNFRQGAQPDTRGWKALLDRLSARLSAIDSRAPAEALVWILRTKESYVYQNLAGTLLLELELPCPVTLDDFMDIISANFNASANLTIRYICRSFGDKAVMAALEDRFRHAAPNSAARKLLRCVSYWMHAHDRPPFTEP
jgi:hypothetical protein